MDAAEGKYGLFRYRRYARDDSLLWLANCIIPYSDEAIQLATDRFVFRPGKRQETQKASLLPFAAVKRVFTLLRGAIIQLGCGTYEDPCDIPGVGNWCGEYPDDPECEDEEPPDDPTDPWGGGPGGGGSDPCYDCYPGGGGGGSGPGENAFARMTCTGAVRGGNVKCEITVDPATADLTVEGWQFVGGGFDTIRSSSTSRTWSGVGVVSGQVRANIELEGHDTYVFASLTVSNRSWSWGPGQWTLDSGGLSSSCFPPYDSTLIPGLAANHLCQPIFVLPVAQAGQGYTVAQGTGPNQGLWYVSGVSFRVDARYALHPAIQPGGPTWASTIPTQVQACRTALGLPSSDPAAVSMYTFNDVCIPTPDYFTWLSYTRAHEQHHLDLIREAATQNDLYARLEPRYAASESARHTAVRDVWNEVAGALHSQTATIDHPYVTIWTGDAYLWYVAGQYFSLNQVEGYQ